MQSHEAIQAAINGKSVDHARALGLSLSMVGKWQEPSLNFEDSGAYNPLDRVLTIITTSRDLGNTPERYLSPLYFLAERFNQIIFTAPSPNKNLAELHQEISKLTKEFGDVLSESGARLADGDISKKDVLAIKKEGNELQRALSSFMAKVEKVSKNQ